MISTFESIAYDESIIVKSRRSIFSIIPVIVVLVILLALPIVLLLIAIQLKVPIYEKPNINILLLSASCYYMIYLLVATSEVVSNYYDLLLVTDKHVVIIEQSGMFSRKILQFNLGQIEDINASVTGFISTIFGFGTIVIQTAGTKELTVVHGMPSPQKIASKIMELGNIHT